MLHVAYLGMITMSGTRCARELPQPTYGPLRVEVTLHRLCMIAKRGRIHLLFFYTTPVDLLNVQYILSHLCIEQPRTLGYASKFATLCVTVS